MKASDLKNWMKNTGMTAVDIASTLKIHPNTVDRYLKGKPAHRSTEAAFERLIESTILSEKPGGKKATVT